MEIPLIVTDEQDTSGIAIYYLNEWVDLIPQCQALYKHTPEKLFYYSSFHNKQLEMVYGYL